jgi:hypothetical protein
MDDILSVLNIFDSALRHICSLLSIIDTDISTLGSLGYSTSRAFSPAASLIFPEQPLNMTTFDFELFDFVIVIAISNASFTLDVSATSCNGVGDILIIVSWASSAVVVDGKSDMSMLCARHNELVRSFERLRVLSLL